MLKFAGALLLLCGCVGVGMQQVRKMDRRVTVIRSLLRALETLERELSFRIPLMEEMLSAAANAAEEPTCSFLLLCKDQLKENTGTTFANIWNNAAKEKFFFLKKQELDPVCALGEILGRYDCEGQKQAIRQTCAALEDILVNAESERKNRGRVCKVLSTVIGAFLVILLL